MITDPTGDALIRIKNGYLASNKEVVIPYSKLIFNLCQLLAKQGYILNVKKKENTILVILKYEGKTSSLTAVKRVSRPTLRVYKGYRQLPWVLNGLGMAIISTPQGLMTDKEARKKKLGGEVMAEVW